MKNKNSIYIYLVGFAIYLALSLYYAMERIVMPDTAFQLFSILKNEDFAIQIQRFGAALTQAFPLIGLKLNVSLSKLLHLYSISFSVVYLSLFTGIIFLLKDYATAFIFFLFHFAITTHSFFWIQCELILGISLLLFYFSFLDYYHKKKFNFLLFFFVSVVLVTTLAFIHPLVVIPFSFFILYRLIQSRFHIQYQEVLGFSLFFVLLYIKRKFFTNYYDSAAMENIKNVLDLYPKYFYATSARNFLNYVTRDYYFLLISIPLIFSLLYRQKWVSLILFSIYFFGTITLINACYINGAEQFYLEGQYSILTLFISSVLIREFEVTFSKILPIFLVIILSLFTYRVITSSSIYSRRIQYYTHLVSLFPNKAILTPNESLRSKLKFTWGSSYEIWLLSTIENKRTSSILIHDNPAQFANTVNNPSVFLTNWKSFEYKELNRKYFIFKDTTRYKYYQFVNSN